MTHEKCKIVARELTTTWVGILQELTPEERSAIFDYVADFFNEDGTDVVNDDHAES